MRVLFWGSNIFLFAFVVHLLFWKIHLPKRQTKILLQIIFGTLVLSLFSLRAGLGLVILPPQYTPETIYEYLHIALFVTSLALAYTITYSAIEVDSPSLVIINEIAKAGPEGLDEKLFIQRMNDDLLVTPRLRDIINDKMACVENGRYKLTPKGYLLARIFIIYRKILNTDKGG